MARCLHGPVLGLQCVLPLLLSHPCLLLGVAALLFCHPCLFLGGLALLVADMALLGGYFLHLGIDTLHHGGLLFLQGQLLDALLQGLVPVGLSVIEQHCGNAACCGQQQRSQCYGGEPLQLLKT